MSRPETVFERTDCVVLLRASFFISFSVRFSQGRPEGFLRLTTYDYSGTEVPRYTLATCDYSGTEAPRYTLATYDDSGTEAPRYATYD